MEVKPLYLAIEGLRSYRFIQRFIELHISTVNGSSFVVTSYVLGMDCETHVWPLYECEMFTLGLELYSVSIFHSQSMSC